MTEIIEVEFSKGADQEEPNLRVKRRHYQDCNHKHSAVDDRLRRVTCRDCGELLDPVEVLLELARDIERVWSNHCARRKELMRMSEEIEDLKRQRKNLKAQVCRWSGKARLDAK